MSQPKSGLCPCGNCFATVHQDEFVAVEKFSSFTDTLRPGLAFVGLDLCGICINFKSLSSRVQLLTVRVNSKTKDNTFVTISVAVHISVIPDRLQDAMYKLQDLGGQIDSYVSDVARATLPNMMLDDVFEGQDRLTSDIHSKLTENMAAFGWHVHKALIVGIDVDAGVVKSINEVNKQKRLRDAQVMAAEAEKIRTVKRAEAEADKSALQGMGIARQRAAIIDGLRQAISTGDGSDISTDEIRQLLLTTQYFETLGYIGSRPNSQTYYLPRDDPNDAEGQIRSGIIQGQVGARMMEDAALAASGSAGRQAREAGAAAALMAKAEEEAAARRRQQALKKARAPSQQDMSFPSYAPPPPRQTGRMLQIEVPPGAIPGQPLQINAPDGRMLQITVPPGVQPGQRLEIQV